MSCQSNTNKGTVAASQSGIPTTASKAAYVTTVGVWAVGGGATGAMVGGPIGAMVGTGSGAWFGSWRAKKKAEARANRAEERAWKGSEAGQKAITAYDRALTKAKTEREQTLAPVDNKIARAKQRYQTARDAGLAEVKGVLSAQGVKGKIQSPEAKAAAGAVVAGARNVLTEVAITKMVGADTSDVKVRASRQALRQTGTLSSRVKNAREQTWRNTAAGQKAVKQYTTSMRKLKTQRAQINQAYRLKKQQIENRYDSKRERFAQHYTAQFAPA